MILVTPMLPPGIWYEQSKHRYRVRLYRNNVSYPGGYFDNLPDALIAWSDLRLRVNKLHKLKRGTRPTKVIFGTTVNALCLMLLQEQNPNNPF